MDNRTFSEWLRDYYRNMRPVKIIGGNTAWTNDINQLPTLDNLVELKERKWKFTELNSRRHGLGRQQ
jgi:hypothetical protein